MVRRRFPAVLLPLVAAALGAETPPSPGVATPLELLNTQLPSWLRLTGELRLREEGFYGLRFQPGNDDMYLLTRVRLGVQVSPTPWLRLFAQAQDAHVLFTDRIAPAPPFQDTADLRQAYIELGGTEKRRVGFRLGRQELAFGEERLVGAANWGNISRSFDAARLTLQGGGYRVDAFAASVVVPRDHVWDRPVDGDNLHGLYAVASRWVPQARVEPYAFWHVAPTVRGETGPGRLDLKTVGLRWAGALPRKFEYTMEMATQTGRWGPDRVRAWAGFWRVGRVLDALPLSPRLRLEANYATGDQDPRDGRHGTFDVLYPTPHDKYGLADQVGWKNVRHVGLVLEAKPRPSLTLQVKGHTWWLASARDGLYNAGGALLARDPTGRSGTHVGEEVDVQALWAQSRHVQVGLGLGRHFPGSFLRRATPGRGYTFPYVSITYGL